MAPHGLGPPDRGYGENELRLNGVLRSSSNPSSGKFTYMEGLQAPPTSTGSGCLKAQAPARVTSLRLWSGQILAGLLLSLLLMRLLLVHLFLLGFLLGT